MTALKVLLVIFLGAGVLALGYDHEHLDREQDHMEQKMDRLERKLDTILEEEYHYRIDEAYKADE